jgi:hypothetical protein
VTVRIQPGQYGATWWEAATGRQIALPSFNVTAPAWTSPAAPGEGDWALLLRRRPHTPTAIQLKLPGHLAGEILVLWSRGQYLPEGLVEGCKPVRDVKKDAVLTYNDVELPPV